MNEIAIIAAVLLAVFIALAFNFSKRVVRKVKIALREIFPLFLLVLVFYNLTWCAEPESDKPELKDAAVSSVPFFVQSTATFADIDKNGVIDSQENRDYESKKIKNFDIGHDGKLNKAEKAKFELIDKIISGGGKSLEGLSDEDKQLYKKWREFILSLIKKSQEKSASEREKKARVNSILKCFPDKVCDDPSSPYYGTMGSHDISFDEKDGFVKPNNSQSVKRSSFRKQ